ncbi:MAG: bacteriohemerythrin [Spirochaetaceae bacterium]|jgi:hemerythrin|nr:bacteriohemerythrin [Spirochaetaceae bacterium]
MANKLVVQWSDEYSVGVKLIDDQHKGLIEMTNELALGVEKGGAEAEVYFLKVIQGAVRYVKTHFTTEEIIMERLKFPEYLPHKKEHEEFVAEVLRDVKAFEDGQKMAPLDFAKFLQQWVLTHIAKSDKKYAHFFNELRAKGQLDESMFNVG